MTVQPKQCLVWVFAIVHLNVASGLGACNCTVECSVGFGCL